jgi:hypothetical protein
MDFPTIPDVPGVPALANIVGAELPLPATELADAIGLGSLLAPKWGIFDSAGTAQIVGDSAITVDIQKDYRISDYPVVNGGFSSFNKVATPVQVRFTFAISGIFSLKNVISAVSASSVSSALQGLTGQGARMKFLTLLDTIVGDTNIYSVHTPDQTFPSVSLTHYNYRRDRTTAAMLLVDVWAEEIRVTGTATSTSTTQSASGAPTADGGTVQVSSLTASQQGIVQQDGVQ